MLNKINSKISFGIICEALNLWQGDLIEEKPNVKSLPIITGLGTRSRINRALLTDYDNPKERIAFDKNCITALKTKYKETMTEPRIDAEVALFLEHIINGVEDLLEKPKKFKVTNEDKKEYIEEFKKASRELAGIFKKYELTESVEKVQENARNLNIEV